MQVIGAGFGRTGTMSLKAALEQLLGGTCYHMYEVLRTADHFPKWWRISNGQTPDWPAIFGDYTAAVDWPAAAYYAELADAYPQAKVVLTMRDPERWYASARETIYTMSKMMGRMPASWLVGAHPSRRYFPEMADNIIWGPGANSHFDGKFEDKDHALRVYNDHIDAVKQRIPAERLLLFDVKEGWGPLAEFLGKPVPATPFPNTNDRAQMLRMKRGLQIASYTMLPVTVPLAMWRTVTGYRLK